MSPHSSVSWRHTFPRSPSSEAFQFEVDAEQACVAAVDPEKLQRVLMNLVGQHLQVHAERWPDPVPASFGGGDQLDGPLSTIQAQECRQELQHAIFERFRQVDGGINRKVVGHGAWPGDREGIRRDAQRSAIHVSDSDLGGARFYRRDSAGDDLATADADGEYRRARRRRLSKACSRSCASPIPTGARTEAPKVPRPELPARAPGSWWSRTIRT